MPERPGKGAADFFMQGYAAFCGKNAVYRYLFSGGGNAEALHHLFQCADIHRLGQMLVHTGFLALFHVLGEGVCGHGKCGDRLAQRVFAAADGCTDTDRLMDPVGYRGTCTARRRTAPAGRQGCRCSQQTV